jgi:hypothetical protein
VFNEFGNKKKIRAHSNCRTTSSPEFNWLDHEP